MGLIDLTPIGPGDVPTYFGFAAAVAAAVVAIRSFRRQTDQMANQQRTTAEQFEMLHRQQETAERQLERLERQNDMLERQLTMALAEAERTSAREHRYQADRMAAWIGSEDLEKRNSDQWLVHLLNKSDEPVYDVVMTIVFIQGAGPERGEEMAKMTDIGDWQQVFSIIPPGHWCTDAQREGLMHSAWGVELAFTDRSGNHWIRRGRGELEESRDRATSHFELERPFALGTPRLFGHKV